MRNSTECENHPLMKFLIANQVSPMPFEMISFDLFKLFMMIIYVSNDLIYIL